MLLLCSPVYKGRRIFKTLEDIYAETYDVMAKKGACKVTLLGQNVSLHKSTVYEGKEKNIQLGKSLATQFQNT